MESYCCFSPTATCIYGFCTVNYGFMEALCPLPSAPLFSCINHLGGCNSNSDKEYFIVTGGNRGVGYHTARVLLQRGHNVYILTRDKVRGEQAKDQLIKSTGNNDCKHYSVDLNDLSTIKSFIDHVQSEGIIIRGLVNNAGMIGMESMPANHIGHFALTIGLLPSLRLAVKKYNRVYVVNVASVAHLDGSGHLSTDLDNLLVHKHSMAWEEYSGSKAANVLFGLSFQRNYLRLKLSSSSSTTTMKEQQEEKEESVEGISLLSYHPGVMLTDLWRNNASSSSSSSSSSQQESAMAITRIVTCCCIKHPVVAAIGLSSLVNPRPCFHFCFDYLPTNLRTCITGSSSGSYFQQSCCCCVVPVRFSPLLLDDSLQEKLWLNSMKYVAQSNVDIYNYLSKEKITDLTKVKSNKPWISYCSAAIPCTECLAAAPYCACVSILC